MSKEILVTGATGLVGSRFVELSKDKLKLVTPRENELSILDYTSLNNFVDQNSIKTIINFAAFTNVDGAEQQSGEGEDGLVWQINVEGPKNLAKLCKEKNIFLIQFSTDFVFRGTESDPGPYSEDTELPNSQEGISWYGWTKNRAENALKQSDCRYAIVRIAYPFYAALYDKKLDFAKGFINLFDQGKLYPIFSDQVMSVLNVDGLAQPLQKIIDQEAEGVFHIVSSNTTPPYEFVKYLLEKTRGAKDVVREGSMKEFLNKEGRTPRPRLGGLTTEVTEQKLETKFKTWQEMVAKFANQSNP